MKNNKLILLIDQLKKDFIKNHKELDENSWKFEIITEDKRSQVVNLIYKSSTYSDKDMSRFVAFSPIGPIPKRFNYENVLRVCATLEVGAIAIEDLQTEDGFKIPYLIFRATHLAQTTDYPELYELITKTGEYADNLENKIFSKDTH